MRLSLREQGKTQDWCHDQSLTGYRALAFILSKMPRSYMQMHVTTSMGQDGVLCVTSAVTNCFWSLGSSSNYFEMNDDELVSAMRKCKQDNSQDKLVEQLIEMPDERLWRVYQKLDWYDDVGGIVSVLATVFHNPKKRYNDTAIRFAVDNVHRLRDPMYPLQILLDNCYSKDVQDFITSVIESESAFWKCRAYTTIQYTPLGSVSEKLWGKWMGLMEDGIRYQVEINIRSAPTNSVAQRRERYLKYYLSTNFLYVEPLQARINKERVRQANITSLNVDTNRSMDWIKSAASHKDDTGWTSQNDQLRQPVSTHTNQVSESRGK